MKMKYCRNCGATHDDSVLSCLYCGGPLDGGTQSNAYGAQGNMPYGNWGNTNGAPADPYNGQGNVQRNPYGAPAGYYNGQGNIQGNPYGAPANPYANQRGMNIPQMSNQKMPSQGAYLALVIVGFVCGIIWGVLALSPYNNMKSAILANNAEEARQNAKKIVFFVLIGIVVNALVIFGRFAQS